MTAATPTRAQVRRIVAGAVRDTFNMHPGYLTKAGHKRAHDSLVKRIAGTVSSYVEQSTWGRAVNAAHQEDGVVAVIELAGESAQLLAGSVLSSAPGEIPGGAA